MRPTFGLSLKLILCMIGSMLVVFTALGYQNVQTHRRNLEELTFSNADSLSGIIKASTRHGMLNNNREGIHEIIKAIGVERGINRIRIFNKQGRISFSSDESEVNHTVNKTAEACYACHAAEQPLVRLEGTDRVRSFRNNAGERILGLINPIENGPSCYTAPCHAHGPDERVLGVLDVTMSLANVDSRTWEGEQQLIVNLAGAAFVIAAVVALLVWGMVHRPIRSLHAGTQRVAAGDLETKIRVAARDEMGQLAVSFNRMIDEIRRMNDELKEWGKSLEERVDQKTRELRKVHEHMIQVERMASMGKLAAIVAHEINNPMAGILVTARLLLRKMEPSAEAKPDPQADREHLQLIASEASRCGEIVKNLLQFSRKTKGDYHPADARALILESIRLVRHKLDLAGAKVRTDLPDDVPPIVCDPQEIRQALVAIIINACEAMRQDEGMLEARLRAIPDEGTVEIAVKDNGVGMDEETRSHIFEPFFSTKQEGSGVGLGLAVASGIVQRHGGRIEVDSSPGNGTTLRLYLPTLKEEEGST